MIESLFFFLYFLDAQFEYNYCVIFWIYKGQYLQEHLWALHMPPWWILKWFPCCVQWLLACYFLVPPYSCWRFLWCFMGNMADVDGNDNPINCGVFVTSLQVKTSLWFGLTAAMSSIVVNVLGFQFHREMSCQETMNMYLLPSIFQ